MARAAAAAKPATAGPSARPKPVRASTAARPNSARAKAAPARSSAKAAPTRSKSARAKAAPARHTPRRRAAAPGRGHASRRVSASAAAPAVALPVRVLNAPFTRAARRRTGDVLDALLSGRGWIALVFVLLAGIVFFNVDLLQMNREIARNDAKISTLKREIARNRLDVARLASSERIQEAAAQQGLVLPAPGEVRYLKARPERDAHQAAKRITAPNLAYVPPEPVDTAPEPVNTTVTDPGATDPSATDPAATTTDPTATDPAAVDPATADPAATAPAPTTTTTPAG
jgi:cell division protein FtsL